MTRAIGKYLFKKTWFVRRLGIYKIEAYAYEDICRIEKSGLWPLNIWTYRIDGKNGAKSGLAIAAHWRNIADAQIKIVR